MLLRDLFENCRHWIEREQLILSLKRTCRLEPVLARGKLQSASNFLMSRCSSFLSVPFVLLLLSV